MNVLFVCNQNRHRSKTAEEVFGERFCTKSAGLFNEEPLTETELEWADLVVVMEDRHRAEIAERFPAQYLQKRIINLDVPDTYQYRQPELVQALSAKIEEAL